MKEIIHIHVPKTGGTWLDKVLTEYAGEHFRETALGNGNRCSIEDTLFYRGRWNPPSPYWHSGVSMDMSVPDMSTFGEWNAAHKVAICRNPFDYLVSCYHFGNTDNDQIDNIRWYTPPGVATGAGLSNVRHGIKSFEEYVQKFCDPFFPWFGANDHDEQRYMLFWQMFNHDGFCGVDTIIRQECLNTGAAEMLLRLGHIDKNSAEAINASGKENVGVFRNKRDYRTFYTDDMREAVERKFKAELLLFGYNFDGPTDDSPFVDPGSLFYHPIIPIAGKYLSTELKKMYDKQIREWLYYKGGMPGATQTMYVRGSQSPYLNVLTKLAGVSINDRSTGEAYVAPHVMHWGNSQPCNPILQGWNDEATGVNLIRTITNELVLHCGDSIADLFGSGSTHPLSNIEATAAGLWKESLTKHKEIYWPKDAANTPKEILALIAQKLRDLEKEK